MAPCHEQGDPVAETWGEGRQEWKSSHATRVAFNLIGLMALNVRAVPGEGRR